MNSLVQILYMGIFFIGIVKYTQTKYAHTKYTSLHFVENAHVISLRITVNCPDILASVRNWLQKFLKYIFGACLCKANCDYKFSFYMPMLRSTCN